MQPQLHITDPSAAMTAINMGPTECEAPIILEGWLSKRSRGIATKVWHDRYFFLRGRTLLYFMEPTDTTTPRGNFHLSSSCAVSDIYLRDKRIVSKISSSFTPTNTDAAGPNISVSSMDDKNNAPKDLYCIEITWLKHHDATDTDSSHRLITKENSLGQSSSFSLNNKCSFFSTTPTHEHQSNERNTSTITTDTDSCPPTPVTAHKNPMKMVNHPPTVSTKHIFPQSILRRKKTLQKQNMRLPSSSSSHHHLNMFQHWSFFRSSLRSKSSLTLKSSKNDDCILDFKNHSPSDSGLSLEGTTQLPDLSIPDLTTADTTRPEHHHMMMIDSTLPTNITSSGPTRHYTQLMQDLKRKKEFRISTRLRFEQLQLSQKQNQNKQKRFKHIVRTGEYVAAVSSALTIGIFTAGIGWAVGLVLLCVSAAAGSGCAMAEMGYLWKKPHAKYKLVLAAETIEAIKEWKDAIEYIIACLLEEECVALEENQRQLLATSRNASGDSPQGDIVSNSSLTPIISNEDSRGNDLISRLSNIPFSSVCRWEPLEGGWSTLLGVNSLGMRIFREETVHESSAVMSRLTPQTSIPLVRRMLRLGIQGRPSPPVKTQVIVKAAPLDAFMCIMTRMNYDDLCAPFDKVLVPNSGQRASFRIIETIDDNSDIIHLFFRPIYLFPLWTLPRDFVLFRYWRNETDGSYTIMYDSIDHEKCPAMDGYVRGLMNGIYTIAPPSRSKRGKQGIDYFRSIEDECLLTHVVQVDPRGRIPNLNLPFFASEGYTEAFAVSVLAIALDIRDSLDQARFVSVPLDDAKPPAWKEGINRFRKSVTVADSKALTRKDDDDDEDGAIDIEDDDNHYDPRFSIFEIRGRSRTLTDADTPNAPSELTSSLFSTVPPTYPLNQWAEPEGNSFRVRGKSYKTDGIKVNAGDSLFPLLAVDLVETDSVLNGGLCSHPLERVQKALTREREAKARGLSNSDMPAFVFCVDIVLAGPPTVHMAFFYGIDDISKIDGSNGTPSSLLAKKFFFGESDEFRNSTFKLIPRIVEGNFLVRKAAGSTPAILGKKIKQTYIRSDRFFELIVETGSNPVSAGVLRLCSSYSKYLTADMAFLLEGNDETTLPEKILGCARVKNIDLNKNVRYVGMQDRT